MVEITRKRVAVSERVNCFAKDTRYTRDVYIFSLCDEKNRSHEIRARSRLATVFILPFPAMPINIHLRSSDQLLAQL